MGKDIDELTEEKRHRVKRFGTKVARRRSLKTGCPTIVSLG